MSERDLVGLVFNSRLAEAERFVGSLVESLGLQGSSWTSSATQVGQAGERLERTYLIVTAGGDGTILRTLRAIGHLAIPIVGINMGRVGFMTELKVDDAADRLPAYLNGELRVEERMMLEASVVSARTEEPRTVVHGLNDAVVGQSGVARLLDITASVDGVPLTSYRADALVVSTATGSTGYALSAGGPILYPEARVILLQPVAAHTGLREGMVLPEDSVVELSAGDGGRAVLSVDGFQDATLEDDDRVYVKRSPHVARFLRASPRSSFYSSLTRRLGLVHRWGSPEVQR